MKNFLRKTFQDITPPILWKAINSSNSDKFGFFGNYSSWEAVQKKAMGYDSDLIINKVKNALIKIKNGEAVYERDSVLFDKVQYSWPLLSALLYIILENNNKLSILDFGGSLGSTFYQNKAFFSNLNYLKWSIVEQEKFVKVGKENFEDDTLKFYYNIDECLKEQKPDAILLSSVLQYIEKPYNLINDILNYDFNYIIIDRTTFNNEDKDRLTLQVIPPEIYQASYPAWFFDENKFMNLFSSKYDIIAEFDALAGNIKIIDNKKQVWGCDKGFILKRKQQE